MQKQAEFRLHDLSDGFALVGPRSRPRALSGVSADSVQLRKDDGTTYFEIKGTTLNVKGATINLTGGTVVLGPATTIDGKVFLNHVHKNTQPGTGLSGVVN